MKDPKWLFHAFLQFFNHSAEAGYGHCHCCLSLLGFQLMLCLRVRHQSLLLGKQKLNSLDKTMEEIETSRKDHEADTLW
jgi:hypothetical protein